MDLRALQQQIAEHSDELPPVENWDPDFCGDIDMQIHHDGSWYYLGTPIGRKSLVNLFSRVLKKENDKYFLVTPVEKIGIQVEDVPFLITQCEQRDGFWVFTTNCEDTFIVGDDHPVTLQKDRVTGDVLPYVNVRRNLWGRVNRNVFYHLAEHGELTDREDIQVLEVRSGDYRFILGEV